MNQPQQPAPAAPPSTRSEGLLPADQNDPNLQVAEEVAFDLQSDEARKVGSMPPATSPATEAVADSLRPDTDRSEDSSRPV